MNNCWQTISDPYKGVALITLGTIFLLYTFGYLKGLGVIIVITSIGIIGYGLMLCGVDKKLKALLKKKDKM